MTAAGTFARYISWRFVATILGVFMLCVMLIFLADMIELLRRVGKYGMTEDSPSLVLISLLRVPVVAEIILPFAVLIGSIGAFLMLSRRSELVVVRAAGMSAWQFILPGVFVAMMFGILGVTVFNPFAAWAKAESERLYTQAFDKKLGSLMESESSGSWLRQDGTDGQSVVHANIVSENGMSLTGVTVFQYDKEKNFFERIEAKSARLRSGYWVLENATVSAVGREPAHYERYLVSTYLTPTQVHDSLGSVRSISFWELPGFIELADRAGLSATRHKMRYQMLLSEPLLLAVMVLLAATCSLQAFRFGKVQAIAITGLGAGFAFFIFREISRHLGRTGLAAPEIAAWAPAVIAGLLTLTVLLYREDG